MVEIDDGQSLILKLYYDSDLKLTNDGVRTMFSKFCLLSLATVILYGGNSFAQEEEQKVYSGAELYARKCQNCHTKDYGGSNKVGPNLYSILGKEAGADPTYKRYSKALKESDFVWTMELLDEYIKNSKKLVPGNRMACGGISDAEERRKILEYMTGNTY